MVCLSRCEVEVSGGQGERVRTFQAGSSLLFKDYYGGENGKPSFVRYCGSCTLTHYRVSAARFARRSWAPHILPL